MKTLYTIEAIVGGLLFGVIMFAASILIFGLPFVNVTLTSVDVLYLEVGTAISIAFGVFMGAFWGWHMIAMRLEFDW